MKQPPVRAPADAKGEGGCAPATFKAAREFQRGYPRMGCWREAESPSLSRKCHNERANGHRMWEPGTGAKV